MRFKGGMRLVPRGGILKHCLLWVTLTAPVFFVGGGIVTGEVCRYLWLDRPGLEMKAIKQAREIEYQRLTASVRHTKRRKR